MYIHLRLSESNIDHILALLILRIKKIKNKNTEIFHHEVGKAKVTISVKHLEKVIKK